jgi:hypothetical protein
LFNLFGESLLNIRGYEFSHLLAELFLAEFRSLASAVPVKNRVEGARIVSVKIFLCNELNKKVSKSDE